MKRFTIILALVLVLGYGTGANAQNYKDDDEAAADTAEQVAPVEKTEAFESDEQKALYCLGMSLGSYVRNTMDDIDVEMLIKGVRDAVEGKESLAGDEEERNEFLGAFMAARQQAEGQKRAEEGRKFLEENQKKDGVQVTDSGLQYKIVKPGSGRSPKATDKVKVHYKGTFLDGEVFDSSYERGEPAEFNANQLIPGWTEGLQLMREGAKYMMWIPYNLAYGEQGRGPSMPGYSTLVFEVELLEVLTPEEGEAPKPAVEE